MLQWIVRGRDVVVGVVDEQRRHPTLPCLCISDRRIISLAERDYIFCLSFLWIRLGARGRVG